MKKLILTLSVLFIAPFLWADGITPNTVWEFRPDATPGMFNGGGFDRQIGGTTGTDFSTQPAYQYHITDAVCGSTCTELMTAQAVNNMLGNVFYVAGGSNAFCGRYVITAVNPGVSISVDASTRVTRDGGVIDLNIGGALDLNSSTQCDTFFEIIGGSNTIYVQAGTWSYTLGGSISINRSTATAYNPINMIGYNSVRGDSPTPFGKISSAPLIDVGANTWSLNNAQFNFYNLRFTGTASGMLSSGSGKVINCKLTMTSLNTNRPALSPGAGMVIGNEIISQNGMALSMGGQCIGIGNLLRDSGIGIGGGANTIAIGNLLKANRNTGILTSQNPTWFIGNTIIGYVGMYVSTGISQSNFYGPAYLANNVIYGHYTGYLGKNTSRTLNGGYETRNNYYNNVKNSTFVFTEGDYTTYLDPQFTDISEYSGTKSTTDANVMTSTHVVDFSQITDGEDYLHILGGTGVTVGDYLITQHWSSGTVAGVIVNNPLGTSTAQNVKWVIPYGKNMSMGTNLKGTGFPLQFGTSTYNYLDNGAVQRQEPAASSGGTGFFLH